MNYTVRKKAPKRPTWDKIDVNQPKSIIFNCFTWSNNDEETGMNACGSQAYFIFVTGTTGGARGEKICHVEKFLHMTYCYLKRFSTWQIDTLKNFSTWEMWIQSVNWTNDVYNLWYFVTLNCWKILFFGDLRCFVEIFLPWFTRFCVEKNWAKNCVCGEKRTNMMYGHRLNCSTNTNINTNIMMM